MIKDDTGRREYIDEVNRVDAVESKTFNPKG